MLKKIFFVFLSFIFIAQINTAKADFPFNGTPTSPKNWEIYTNMRNVFTVAADRQGKMAFCGTQGGVYVVDLGTANIVKKFTNINGLISNSINCIFVDSLNRVWIGAADGSISIYDIASGTFRYIYDIKNYSQANKSINYFYQYYNYMFVATGYGIHKISMKDFTFVDAPYLQLGNFSANTIVKNITVAGNLIAAGTVSGVAWADINSTLNNPASWSNFTAFTGTSEILSIETVLNRIYIGTDNGIKYYDGTNWIQSDYFINRYIAGLKVVGNNLYSIIDNKWIFYSPISNLNEIHQFADTSVYIALAADNKGSVIGGTYRKGIVINYNGTYPNVYPNGPYSSSFLGLAEDNFGNIWGCPGDDENGMCRFDGKTWTNYIVDSFPTMGQNNNIRRLVFGDNTLWAFSYGGGIIKYQNGVFKNYNPSNSNIPGYISGSNYCVPWSGAYDLSGRLIVSFYQSAANLLYSYNPADSTFRPFSNYLTMQNLGPIAVDAYNTKWIVGLEGSKGVFYYNNRYADTSSSSDIRGLYTISDFTGVATINDIAVDKNNQVWICTDNGVFFVSNPYYIIQNPNLKPALEWMSVITGNLKIPFIDNCTCIAVDVLNQKWVGTLSNGVFHFSEDGTTLIEQFNTSNSYIASNTIQKIIISPNTGKAYFGTPNGLSVVQTTSLRPVSDFDEIKCAPNPYVIPSSVQLQIDGLVEGSSVKIISLKGEVMAEFDTPGGRIGSWNGLDKRGNLVPSGIYIVIGYNKDGTKVGKGKLAVVRK